MSSDFDSSQLSLVSFPDLSNANEDGLLAMGGNLEPAMLLSAYAQGIFPWFNNDQPILWWSPDPRMVLVPADVKISRSMRKVLNRGAFRVTCNTAFERVIKACALRGQTQPFAPAEDTWITKDMLSAYTELHALGFAHSIETWQDNELVGGLYGVSLGNTFFGESMFSTTSNASKAAFIALCRWLEIQDYSIVDCQVHSDHLASLGAIEIPRENFLSFLHDIDFQSPNPNFARGFSEANLLA